MRSHFIFIVKVVDVQFFLTIILIINIITSTIFVLNSFYLIKIIDVNVSRKIF